MCLKFSNSTEFSVDNEIHQKFSRRRKITVPICSVVLFDQVSTGTPPTTECDITTIYTEVVNLKAVPQSLLISCSYIVCVLNYLQLLQITLIINQCVIRNLRRNKIMYGF